LAAGIVEANERGLATIAPKFEGWIERLYVNTTGQAVARGQAVAEVYSPELVSAQREYLIARAGKDALAKASSEAVRGMGELEQNAATRLRNWDITAQQIERLATEGDVRHTLTLTSPVSGSVIEKPAVQGMRFMPGEVLLKIADLSTVWLIAEVFEQDISSVRVGQEAVVRFNAYAERSFRGKVSFVYPTLNPETRTAKVRIDLPNPDGALKPAMYGTVQLAAGGRAKGLTVPDSAVIDSGSRRVVLVQRGEGRFEPREVKTGTRADGYVEIREGVAAGEQVVVKANFLIDAESNLKAALGSFGHAGHGGASTSKTDQTSPPGTQVAGQEGPVAKGQSGAVHSAEGRVQEVNTQKGRVTVAHGPVPSLKWPAMTMDFQVDDPSALTALKPGQKIRFEFVEDRAGRYVIRAATVVAPAAGTHTGH
jgi:RND family efflux transporter MFP subunit